MSAGFTEVIAKNLIGKNVEIFQGNRHFEQNYSDHNNDIKSIIYGKLIDATGDCLTVEVSINNKVGLVFINSWTIQSICCPDNGVSIEDIYVESPQISKLIKRKISDLVRGKK